MNVTTARDEMTPKPERAFRPADRRRANQGLSVLELLVTMLILAIVAGLSLTGYRAYIRHAQKATCISHIRHIHQGLTDFLTDRGHWPQPTIPIEEVTEDKWFAWWFSVLEPYGVGPEIWLCPADEIGVEAKEKGLTRSSYLPTSFDAHRATPFRWKQPWVMERGDFHGKGAHIVMPDGSVSTTLTSY